ncbi:MAG TPA: MFS transporter, partial [Pseudomonas sp.]|nr:MFS transporter [Pseudomonas sp.]
GVGPTAVALVTDYGFGDDQALRYSLLIVSGLALFSSVLLLSKGLKPYRESVVRLQGWSAQPA